MTLTRPSAGQPVTSPAARAGLSRTDLRLVSAMTVLLVVTQRLGVPAGGTTVSLAIPLTYLFVGVMVLRRVLVVSRLRAELFALATAAVLLTTVLVSVRGDASQISFTSLGLLLAIYVPWVFSAGGPHGWAILQRVGHTFIWVMMVLGLVGTVQLVAQFAGVWQWDDYIDYVVPSSFVIQGFNDTNELTYGSGLYKANAFVLLEPSFLSQFAALAMLIGLMLRVPGWKLVVLATGLASAVSGTGLLLLGAGLLLLVVRARRRLRPAHVAAGVAVAAAVLLSPLGSFFLARQGDLSGQNTSGNARFNAPYQTVWNGLLDDPIRFFTGAGPGSVERVLPSFRGSGVDILYSALPKLAFEYGLIAGGLVVLFLVLSTVDRIPWRVVPAALVVMFFLLSGALHQPQIAYLVWMLSGLGAADRAFDRGRGSQPPGVPEPVTGR